MSDLLSVVKEIWASGAGLEVGAAAGCREAPGLGFIALVRGERSAVLLECPASLALRAAARLRGTEPHRLAAEEVEEAVAELVARLGTRLLSGERISRPTAVMIDGEEARPRPGRRAAFACEGQVFHVTVTP